MAMATTQNSNAGGSTIIDPIKQPFEYDIRRNSVHLIKYPGDKPLYDLIWRRIAGDRHLSLTGNEIWSYTTVQKKIGTIWNFPIEDMKAKQWRDLFFLLIDNGKTVTEDVTEADLIAESTMQWLRGQAVDLERNYTVSDLGYQAIYKDGFMCFRKATLYNRWLQRDDSLRHNVDLGDTAVDRALSRVLGAKSEIIWFKDEKRNERVWKIPYDKVQPLQPYMNENPIQIPQLELPGVSREDEPVDSPEDNPIE